MERLKEFLDWHCENHHNVNFKMIVAKEDREETLKMMHEISELLNMGLIPEQIRELNESIRKLKGNFGDAITVNQIIDFFVDFYIAIGDPDRVEAAELLTNEEVIRYRELKERDTAKAPEEIQDAFGDGRLICPNCRNSVINYFNRSRPPQFCMICGQRLKWED